MRSKGTWQEGRRVKASGIGEQGEHLPSWPWDKKDLREWTASTSEGRNGELGSRGQRDFIQGNGTEEILEEQVKV